ncbi:MAG: cytochrome b N-terminal domain-containing protein, partial [Gammaproteobacteria bacterium]
MNTFYSWLDRRFPFREIIHEHLTGYYAPKNFNILYYFGSMALLVLLIQILSGIFLLSHYHASAAQAFNSIQTIMYDVKWGWLIRYLHTTGVSFFFIAIYLHMLRGYLYGSFRSPRELLWIIGYTIYLV